MTDADGISDFNRVLLHLVQDLQRKHDELRNDIQEVRKRAERHPFSVEEWRATEAMLNDWKEYKDKIDEMNTTVTSLATKASHWRWLGGIARNTLIGLAGIATAIYTFGDSALKVWYLLGSVFKP
jgi:hypothetical protein